MSWTVAEANLLADFGNDSGTMRTLSGYTFLGDPLSPLRRPLQVCNVPVEEPPSRVELGTNSPNPFNPATTIRFSTKRRTMVDLSIFDLRGRKVQTLVHENLLSGPHEIVWRGTDETGAQVASGTYFYRLETDGVCLSRKLVLLK